MSTYSSTQIVELSNLPNSGGRTLNLDGAASLIQSGEWSREEVGMDLVASESSTMTRYLFNRFTTFVHTVQVGRRQFNVRLLSVRDKSRQGKTVIAYTFGISET